MITAKEKKQGKKMIRNGMRSNRNEIDCIQKQYRHMWEWYVHIINEWS